MKPILNIDRTLLSIAHRNKTSLDTSRIILDNNRRLCNELNDFYKHFMDDKFILDLDGNIAFRHTKSNGMAYFAQVAENKLQLYVEYMRKALQK